MTAQSCVSDMRVRPFTSTRGPRHCLDIADDEISDLDLDDLFSDDIVQLMKDAVRANHAASAE